METIKYSEIKGLDAKAIDAQVSELRRKLFDLKMQKGASGIEKPHLIKMAKKNIARLLTAKTSVAGSEG